MNKYFITGGCGFIGSNFVRNILKNNNDAVVINLDKLTYAGNPKNLEEFEKDDRYIFYHGDICDAKIVKKIFNKHNPDYLVNFAAELVPSLSRGALT